MVIPDGYGQTTIKFTDTIAAEVVATTYGFHNTPIDDALTIANSMATTWDGNFTAAQLSDKYELTSAYVLINIGGVMQSAEVNIGTVGTVATDPPPPAVAIGIKKETSYAGKHYRGRMYLPAGYVRKDKVDAAGHIDAAVVSALQGSIDNVKGLNNTDGYPWYLLHNDATAPTPVNQLLVHNIVRTQRRRQHIA